MTEVLLMKLSLNLVDDRSTLVQVMAWCHQATSHYLSQCWPRFTSSYGVTRLKWVKPIVSTIIILLCSSSLFNIICFSTSGVTRLIRLGKAVQTQKYINETVDLCHSLVCIPSSEYSYHTVTTSEILAIIGSGNGISPVWCQGTFCIAASNFLNHWWFIIKAVLWHSPDIHLKQCSKSAQDINS